MILKLPRMHCLLRLQVAPRSSCDVQHMSGPLCSALASVGCPAYLTPTAVVIMLPVAREARWAKPRSPPSPGTAADPYLGKHPPCNWKNSLAVEAYHRRDLGAQL